MFFHKSRFLNYDKAADFYLKTLKHSIPGQEHIEPNSVKEYGEKKSQTILEGRNYIDCDVALSLLKILRYHSCNRLRIQVRSRLDNACYGGNNSVPNG